MSPLEQTEEEGKENEVGGGKGWSGSDYPTCW